jgi:hypothetical protein
MTEKMLAAHGIAWLTRILQKADKRSRKSENRYSEANKGT